MITLIAGIPGGHIPGSINIPFQTFLTNDEGSKFQTMRPKEELLQVFRKAEIDLNKPLIATCGMGKNYITILLNARITNAAYGIRCFFYFSKKNKKTKTKQNKTKKKKNNKKKKTNNTKQKKNCWKNANYISNLYLSYPSILLKFVIFECIFTFQNSGKVKSLNLYNTPGRKIKHSELSGVLSWFKYCLQISTKCFFCPNRFLFFFFFFFSKIL